MLFHKIPAVSLGLAGLLALSGCSSDKSATPPPAGPSCDVDYTTYAGGAPVSLKTDLMPIFGQSCTTSLCHNAKDKRAGLYLGVRCQTDAVDFTKCTFPDMVDPNSTSANPPSPLTDQIVADVKASLLANSETVTSPTVPRVIPGDPEHSFLMQKISGTANDHGYVCKNQDTTHSLESPPLPCGDWMPLGPDSLCSENRPAFDKIARWIAQGASNP